MPLFALLLILGLLLADPVPQGLPWPDALSTLPSRLALIVAPKLLLIAAGWYAARRASDRLDTDPDRTIRRFGRWRRGLRIALVLSFAVDLSLGWLGMVRACIGDPILVDEALALLPTIVVAAAGWWFEYPIDRRFREALLIRRLDEGAAITPIWSRTQFVVHQARHQLARGLVPGALFFTWWDIAGRVWPADGGPPLGPLDPQTVAALLGAAIIAVLAPPLLCRAWDTRPLPDSPLRQRLEELCRQRHVRVRRILLWRTYGSLANAAVIGPWRPVRYVLLSDALLDALHPIEIEAVMAHELAHVRRHHIPWMMLLLLAAAGLIGYVVELLATAAGDPGWVVDAPVGLMALMAWILVFGLISRPFERQADAFAVAHLSTSLNDPLSNPPSDPPGRDDALPAPPRVSETAVATMARTLLNVARLNGMDPHRRDFRHGSIHSRIAAMQRLAGCPIDRLPIDATVRRLKLVGLAAMIVLIVVVALQQ